jgi:hypothetical protein
MLRLFRRTPDERLAARRHRIWADLAMMSRDLDVLVRGNWSALAREEREVLANAYMALVQATALLERNNRR